MAVSFMIGGNRNTNGTDITGKTTDLPQVTDKLYHIKLYWVNFVNWNKTATLLVVGTDCMGRS